MPRIKGHLTYEGQTWIIVSFEVFPRPDDPPTPQAASRAPDEQWRKDGSKPPPPVMPPSMASRGPSMDFTVREDGQVVHNASGEEQGVSATWVIGREVKPGVRMHSWIPRAQDFDDVLELRLRDGVVVESRIWNSDVSPTNWVQRGAFAAMWVVLWVFLYQC